MKTTNYGASATKTTLRSFTSNEAPANAGFNCSSCIYGEVDCGCHSVRKCREIRREK